MTLTDDLIDPDTKFMYPSNNGSVCMPYFGYFAKKQSIKYNGPGPNGHGNEGENLWNKTQ